jgi:hypothetical protein
MGALVVALSLLSGPTSATVPVPQPLTLRPIRTQVVAASAAGFLVERRGEVPLVNLAPWGSIQPTLLLPDRDLPLAAMHVQAAYYWLSWDVAPEVGTYVVHYQSWDPQDYEWQEATFPLEIVDSAPPPTEWGQLEVTETCYYGPGYANSPPEGYIRIEATMTPSEQLAPFWNSILGDWVLRAEELDTGLALPQLARPLNPRMEANVSCNPDVYFSSNFDRPPMPAWVLWGGTVIGQESSPAPLRQALEFNCGTCDWATLGVPPEKIDRILCEFAGESCDGTALGTWPTEVLLGSDSGTPAVDEPAPAGNPPTANTADYDTCTLSTPTRRARPDALVLMLFAASALSFARRRP